MPELLFYHLTERTLEQVLPGLSEKSRERGWNVVIQTGSQERMDVLDGLLWTYRDESFLLPSTRGTLLPIGLICQTLIFMEFPACTGVL